VAQKAKFLFDSCCFGRVALKQLLELVGSAVGRAQIAHLSEFQLHNKLDDDWVPQFVEEGWIVISSDRGTTPSKGSKLPLLCRRFGITHVLLSAAVHDLSTREKCRAIAAVWPDLLALPEHPRGSEHRLQKTHSGGFVLKHAKPRADSSSDQADR
jgi:hypothetical protein